MPELTAAYKVLNNDNGKIFFLNSATEFRTALPSIDGREDFTITFVVKAAPSGADYEITTYANDQYILGSVYTGTAGAAATTVGSTKTTINFVDGSSVAGDWVRLYCDGSAWYIMGGCVKVAAGIVID
tara:strand:+ start:76 stop:459 length:384 start_codon:yes stop_codon:yes gene_type:complete